ncbi:hypothetical protein M885DRAFT_534459 [Pelagophyceae sp. CCMP2097]|nr:hypothetical protein M885DRAFT_534459 [Pelagophyceae sp. CCMP2097]
MKFGKTSGFTWYKQLKKEISRDGEFLEAVDAVAGQLEADWADGARRALAGARWRGPLRAARGRGDARRCLDAGEAAVTGLRKITKKYDKRHDKKNGPRRVASRWFSARALVFRQSVLLTELRAAAHDLANVDCVICQCAVYKPMVLPCGHWFCKPCLRHYDQPDGPRTAAAPPRARPCPTCREGLTASAIRSPHLAARSMADHPYAYLARRSAELLEGEDTGHARQAGGAADSVASARVRMFSEELRRLGLSG